MKLGLKVLIAGALAAALLVPVAAATAGNGNGPPAWAGGGSGGAKENGKPAWAGQGQAKKAEKAALRAAAAESDADAPKHDNPAWVCKFERDQMGTEAFAENFGTNENKANAFGQCVAQEAQDRDGVTGGEEETPEPEAEEPTTPEEPLEEREDALAALQAFFQALRQLMVF